MSRPRTPVLERIEQRLDRSGECWLWTGAIKPNGYVQVLVWIDGEKFMRGIHRVMYEAHVGPIPEWVDRPPVQGSPLL